MRMGEMRLGKNPRAVALVFAACAALLVPASCEDPVSAPGDILAVSSNVQGHFHRATIPARDIADPPPGGAGYVSTTDSGHAHVVQITETQLIDLQQRGTVVSVESSVAGDPAHSHLFVFEH